MPDELEQEGLTEQLGPDEEWVEDEYAVEDWRDERSEAPEPPAEQGYDAPPPHPADSPLAHDEQGPPQTPADSPLAHGEPGPPPQPELEDSLDRPLAPESDHTVEYQLPEGEEKGPEEPLAHPSPGSEGDVLEETPEFLQDTPEHDRLWFEQRPPRDFDFED
jgi:hypothetical protein